MIFRPITGLLFLNIGCPGTQQPSSDGISGNSGLLIENGINRGIDYTDSVGLQYNLRYIPVGITNDSTISIHLQIAFLKEYDYPTDYFTEKFKVFPMPKAWALDGVEITESMIDELKKSMDKPIITEALEPGEKLIIAIGTLYPRSPNITGVLPNALLVSGDIRRFPACDWHLNEEPSSDSEIALGLKLDFRESCMIIPCGLISYPEH